MSPPFLSGDVMSIESYRMIAKAPVEVLPKVLELFTTTAAQVCEGQQYDMDFESVEEISMADYMKMIGLKTAVLIACSAKMGALIAGADERTCDYFYKFGYETDAAFTFISVGVAVADCIFGTLFNPTVKHIVLGGLCFYGYGVGRANLYAVFVAALD